VKARQAPVPSRTLNNPTPVEAHGLGLFDPSPTSDDKLDRIDRRKYFKSNKSPPVARPGTTSSWKWVNDPKYDSELPPSIDWRDHYGMNWVTTVQVRTVMSRSDLIIVYDTRTKDIAAAAGPTPLQASSIL
jgi:hypothetical protein